MSEEIKYKGYTIKIEVETDTQNPRTEWDNVGTMVCFHRRYNLGDGKKDFSGPEELDEFLKKNKKDLVVLPLYLYDHSGLTMKTTPFSCRWDSGQVGYIFVNREDAKYNWGLKRNWRKEAVKRLIAEVATYDDYLTGSVYRYTVIDEDNEIDSCGGYYGDDHEKSGLLESARMNIEGELHNQKV